MRARVRERGQAVVEFSMTIVIFLVMIMVIVDLGRGIYMYNGVSEAAREIARVTSVHQGATFGSSSEITEVIDIQKGLIPNLGNPTFACVDMTDTVVALDGGRCRGGGEGNRVRVTIAAPYRPISPILSLIGTWTMQSTSSLEIP
jgi:hypothetical protein